jgi:hypothetical protein
MSARCEVPGANSTAVGRSVQVSGTSSLPPRYAVSGREVLRPLGRNNPVPHSRPVQSQHQAVSTHSDDLGIQSTLGCHTSPMELPCPEPTF